MNQPHDDDRQTVLSSMMSDWLDGDLGADAMRSFSEVNRRGLEAATTLITRMTDLIDGVAGSSRPAPSPSGPAEHGDDSIARLRGEVMKSIDTWAEVVGSLVETSLDVLHRAGPSTAAGNGERIAIGPLQPGGGAERPIFMHATRGQGMIRCRVGAFESARGAALPGDAVAIDPDVVVEGGDDQVTLHVRLPDDAAPGRYHGFVFADGVTESAVAIEILVAAPS